jgi:hypothetical protein
MTEQSTRDAMNNAKTHDELTMLYVKMLDACGLAFTEWGGKRLTQYSWGEAAREIASDEFPWRSNAPATRDQCVTAIMHAADCWSKLDARTDAGMRPCRWSFDDGPVYDGWTDDTRWNGFLNIWVTAETLAKVKADTPDEDPEHPFDPPLDDKAGLYCLAYGFATTEYREDDSLSIDGGGDEVSGDARTLRAMKVVHVSVEFDVLVQIPMAAEKAEATAMISIATRDWLAAITEPTATGPAVLRAGEVVAGYQETYR